MLRIYTILLSRLRRDSELLRQQQAIYCAAEKDGGVQQRLGDEDLAAKFLDRVKIMRVFDLVGVMEAVGEIREGLEGKTEVVKKMHEEDKKIGEDNAKEDAKIGKHEGGSKMEKIRKTVIADSEGEDDDDEIMLFEMPAKAQQGPPLQMPEPEPQIDQPRSVPEPEEKENDDAGKEAKISFILLDNLAHVLSPILKKDFVKGNILASAFLRSLSNLTKHHSLLTILQNPASILREPTPSRPAKIDSDNLFQAPPQQQQRKEAAPRPSIFSSNKLIPALGNIMAPWLDMHLMVSNIPKRKADARMLAKYTEGRATGAGSVHVGMKGVQMVNVVEVLTDRRGGRTGDWGTFVEGEDGGLRDV